METGKYYTAEHSSSIKINSSTIKKSPTYNKPLQYSLKQLYRLNKTTWQRKGQYKALSEPPQVCITYTSYWNQKHQLLPKNKESHVDMAE